jgi:uncharacterized membrane protein (DUF4010 family)
MATTIYQLAIALGLGLLVGLQREHASARLGGVRTFPLITFLGAICGLLAQTFGGWVVAAGLIGLGGIIVIGNVIEINRGDVDPGITTEVAMLVMFGVGAYLIVGQAGVGVAIGSATAILLHFKGELHAVTAKLGRSDLKAIMQFALISFIILPVLPDRTFGPFNVLNPRNIWLMVVLIVGISLIGYIAYKFFDANTGVILGGILGGLVSSTATTVSNARQSRENDSLVRVAAVVITIATTILYLRVLFEIFAVAPGFVRVAAPPILILASLLAAAGAWFWFGGRKEQAAVPQHGNPSELKSALVFALVYAFVLLAVTAVKEWYGDRGLFVVAILSGLTDVDAITLSISRLVSSTRLGSSEGWRLIVTASLANLLFKVLVIGSVGHRNLLKTIALPYASVLVAGILLITLWP